MEARRGLGVVAARGERGQTRLVGGQGAGSALGVATEVIVTQTVDPEQFFTTSHITL